MERKIEDGFLSYSCGCRFKIDENDNLVFSADTHDPKNTINFSCPETYRVLADFAQGVFQLESPLGKSFVRKLKPENLENLAALGAAIRPGALEAKDENGVSATEHFIRRKNNLEETEPYHPIIDRILSTTYGQILFQEQMLEIAKECAGFTLQEADILRKAIGHKLPEEMAKCKKMFVEGSAKVKVLSEKQAEDIWDRIEKSQRYSFNKCVSGDTIITAPHGTRTNTVKDIYNLFNYHTFDIEPSGQSKKRNKEFGILGYGLSLKEDGTLIKNGIKDIRYSGHFPVFKITTRDGYSVNLTTNHKVPTDNGEMLVGELQVGYRLHSKLLHKLDTALVEILSIEQAGVIDTYDVEMNSPYHTFCADGIVVCNSHAVAYGITGYICAYIKTHFPLQFYAAWLKEENDRTMYKELANEAKVFASIGLYTPDLRDLQEEFYWKGGKCES